VPHNPYYAEGNYVGRILTQSIGESSAKRTPQIVFTVEILGPVDKENPGNYIAGQYEVQQRSVYLFLTEGAVERTLKVLHQLGFDKTSFTYISPATPGYHNFANTEIDLFCEWEPKMKGDGYVEKWGASLGDRAPAPEMETSKIRQLDMLYGRQLKAGKAAAAPKARSATTEIDDTDLPF